MVFSVADHRADSVREREAREVEGERAAERVASARRVHRLHALHLHVLHAAARAEEHEAVRTQRDDRHLSQVISMDITDQ